jgi:branched-chain amino acid transport system ATP-binding protein
MLSLHDVHSYYSDSHILQGISLEVPMGKCTALVGRNGAGKTTTLRTILGYVPPRRGRILYRGESIVGAPTYRTINRGIGFVPEDRGIFASLTVEEHLHMAWVACRHRPHRQRPEAIYRIFPRLAERRSSYGNQLSGGEQQMLAIGRALVGFPNLLMLDEPSEGLSPVIFEMLQEKLQEIKQAGTTILLVEQKYTALRLADYVYVLSQGQVKFSGTPEELECNEDVKKNHLGI